jgi:hypothetical protein
LSLMADVSILIEGTSPTGLLVRLGSVANGREVYFEASD